MLKGFPKLKYIFFGHSNTLTGDESLKRTKAVKYGLSSLTGRKNATSGGKFSPKNQSTNTKLVNFGFLLDQRYLKCLMRRGIH